jgi:hypothetical protein
VTTAGEGGDEQQMASVGDRDGDTPIFLRNVRPLNVPRKDGNLVPQDLNPAYKRPDVRPMAGKSNALIAEQEQSGDVRRTATPWHERQKKILGEFGYVTTDQVLM